MNILITGGAGFIGYHTANAFIELGHQVHILDSLHPQIHKNPRESLERLHPSVEFICGDIRSYDDVRRAVQGAEVVYHFAAETGVGQSMYEIHRYVDVNVRGTAVLLDCLAENPGRIKKLILASSRAVYGEGKYRCHDCGDIFISSPRPKAELELSKWDFDCPKCRSSIVPQPAKEDSPSHPVSIYGITKRTQEELFNRFCRTFQIPAVILRFFNVVGPGQSMTNPYTGIATIFYNRMAAGETVEIYEDGAMLRDFVHIRDVVQANRRALMFDNGQVVVMNIGSGQVSSVLEMARLLKEEMGSQSRIDISGRYRLGDIRHSWGDVSFARESLGYEPEFSVKDGLKDLIAWVRGRVFESKIEHATDELFIKGLTGIAGEKQKMIKPCGKRKSEGN